VSTPATRPAATGPSSVRPWPRDPGPGERRRRLVRVSAHLHNGPMEHACLGEALRELLVEEERG